MAEVLGLVTAIGAIITSGFQLATAISTIVDDLGTAGAQVQAIAVETRTILLTLRSINKHLVRANRVTTEVANIVGDIIALCRKDIDDIKECMAPLLGKRAEEMVLKHKLRWLFAKSKVSTRQASLNSLKLTLALFLQALDLMEEDYIEDYMQAVVQQKVSESKNVKRAFIEAERRDQALEKAYEPSPAISSLKMIDQPGLEIEKLSQTICIITEDIDETDCDQSISQAMVKVIHRQSGDGSSDEEGSDLLPSHQSGLDHTNSTIDLIDDISDDHFMAIADRMRLQKTVSSFALVVLHQRQEMEPGITDAEGASTMPPSDGLLGAQTPFSSSSNAPQTARTPNDATGRQPPQFARNYWEPRYSGYPAPGYAPPHPGPSHGGLNNPEFGFYPDPPRSTSPPSNRFSRHDRENMRMQEELALLRNEVAKNEEERAKLEAERAAREAIEAERKAEEQRQKLHQEAMSRAEREARQKYEEELKAQAEAKMAKQKYEEEILRAAAEAKRQQFLKHFSRKQVDQGKQ
ncbi:hypothetical protein CKAH01_13217 [Colletotrichum kahawae]|uniref:Fungal N-terminal domain-containing protein n=1 Tax=Colletotrichum kahawae TaxID=34407 RepID=A0AAD9YR81_COLKA|nr:hypothetical protein CKAH01_13217 [Colletotrichum kahawae]